MLYRTLGRICYALGLASIVLSLRTQYATNSAEAKTRFFFQRPSTDSRSERQSIFFGLWAPTFAIAGKILEDMGREQQGQSTQTAVTANSDYAKQSVGSSTSR